VDSLHGSLYGKCDVIWLNLRAPKLSTKQIMIRHRISPPMPFKLTLLFVLARPPVCFLGFSGVYLGYWLGLHQINILSLKTLIAAVSVALAVAFGNTMNDVLDQEVDMIIFPFRPIPAGYITAREGLIWGLFYALAALLLASLIGRTVFLLILISILLMGIYNLQLKYFHLFGNLLVAVLSILPGFVGNQIAGEDPLPILPLASVAICVLAREIFRSIHDAPGDYISGRKTVFLALGKETTELISLALVFAAILLLVFQSPAAGMQYSVLYWCNTILMFLLPIVIGYLTMLRWRSDSLKPENQRLLTILWRVMLVAICISLIWQI
jgi:4-hydroxybenzoate polyprenyltransferase